LYYISRTCMAECNISLSFISPIHPAWEHMKNPHCIWYQSSIVSSGPNNDCILDIHVIAYLTQNRNSSWLDCCWYIKTRI
jgi:hypothetical protein